MSKEGCFSMVASLRHFLLWHSSYWIKNPVPKDLCLFLCVNVIWLCAHMNAELCTLTCMYKGHRSWWIIFLYCSPFKIFETGSLTELQSCQLSEAGLLGKPHDPPCICPTVWDYGHTAPQPYFVLFIVRRRGGQGGRSWDRIFCHPGYPWTLTFFPPTPIGLEHRHVSPRFVSNTTTDKYLKLQVC